MFDNFIDTARAREVAAAYQASVQRVLTELLMPSPARWYRQLPMPRSVRREAVRRTADAPDLAIKYGSPATDCLILCVSTLFSVKQSG
jgi:hypothetical protein